jgi:hypothetical protein
MSTKNKIILMICIVIATIVIIIFIPKDSGKYDKLAQCITSSGAEFYGTFWCTHCQSQKAMFGSSKKYLPYIECSSVDGKEQLQVCKDKGIEGYPTWIFSDGSQISGEVSLKILAEKTQCELPL